jgi:mono/diheme cytochrome c family protein
MPVRFRGGFFVGFLTLLLGLISILGILGILATYMPRGSEVVEVQVAGTAEQVERGRALASLSCAGCHSIDKELPLSGGENILADVPIPIGKATPPNLT